MYYNPTLALRGVFLPLWLLARTDLEHGAKLMYTILIQKVNPQGVACAYVPALAVQLGDEEGQISCYLNELEGCGLIIVQRQSAESEVFECTFPIDAWMGRVERSQCSGKRRQPNSRHNYEVCIQYAKAKQQAGEEIRNVFALATHFYKTGYQDEEIDFFLVNDKHS